MVVVCGLLPLLLAAPAADDWLAHLVPRPREVSLAGAWTCAPGAVRLETRTNDPLVAAAADELRALLAKAGTATGSGPTIVLGVGRELSDQGRPQAYTISVQGEALHLAGADAAGVYYAAKTLQQLVAARLQPGRVEIPKLTVRDWPTLLERGFWGLDAKNDLEWLSWRKFNLIEVHADLKVAADGTPHASMNQELLERAGRLGLRVVPIIHHLEQLVGTGVYERFPELEAKVPPSGNQGQRQFKLDHPRFIAVLGKWMADLADYPQVTGITVWLSEEEHGHPLIDQASNPFVVEARVCEAAFEQAQRKRADMRLRLLTTQSTYKYNELILKAVRPGTQIIHYDGSRTYNSGRAPIMDAYFKAWAAAGGWLGVCPIVVPDWRGVAPWHGGEFVQHRMREFAASGVKSLVGYAPPGRGFYPYLLEATAEYSWNPEASDPRSFALRYGLRHAVKDPAVFADWVMTLSPVAWDIYGSRIIVHWCYGSSIPAAAAGGLKLGRGIFAEVPDEARLQSNLAACERARALVAKLDDVGLTAETETVANWQALLVDLWRLNALLPKAKAGGTAEREPVRPLLAAFADHAAATCAAMTAWGQSRVKGGTPPGRWTDTIKAIQKHADELAAVGEKLGFPDTRKAYRQAQVGVWKTELFDRASPITTEYEVTARLDGPGRYEVEFDYTSGLLGLVVHKVTLVAQTGDDRQTRRELAVDQHTCHAGGWNKDHLYFLAPKAAPAGQRYFLLVTMQGGNPAQPAAQRSTNGNVLMRKLPDKP